MSRGLLEYSELEKVSQEIPELSNLQKRARSLSPDFISTLFAPESDVPVASVCLQDAVDTLEEAGYALHEVFAHRMWYLEKKDPPNEKAAIFFTRFYIDDTALRLYSAAEHLANGIVMMLEIDDKTLESYRRNRISQQSVVGRFLLKEKPSHSLTKAVSRLVNSKDWLATLDYRNRWVHEQPPTMEGLGIVYKRTKRWKGSPTGKEHILGLGGGDTPEHSADDLIKFVQAAAFQFSDVLTAVIEFYIGLLESHGMSFGER